MNHVFHCFLYDYSFTLRDTPSPDTCIPFPRNNRTIITDVYGGIPDNLLLNLIGFTVRLYNLSSIICNITFINHK